MRNQFCKLEEKTTLITADTGLV